MGKENNSPLAILGATQEAHKASGILSSHEETSVLHTQHS